VRFLNKIFRKEHKKKIIISGIIIFISIAVIFGGYVLYGINKLDKLNRMSFEEMIEFTTKDKKDAIISVGILKDGEITYEIYGENGKLIDSLDYIYEIGSITKTFTSSLICKAISENKIRLDNTIDEFIPLPDKAHYPTIKELVTHTSGYKGYYFEKPMIANYFFRDNDFFGITDSILLRRLGKINLDKREYKFNYSNFGFATLGLVIEDLYEDNFTNIINKYITEELKLEETRISQMPENPKSNFGYYFDNEYWEWSKGDAYLSAGALLSNISDMTRYLEIQLDGNIKYIDMAHEILINIDATTPTYEKMGIRIDAAGIGWMIDTKENIVWHNGATGNFNSYIGFDKQRGVGVVILSNLPPRFRIPATVMGVKLLKSFE